ncbi:MAG: UDP-N-acetylenolpyruvoylglucosamine reductase [Anaerolinea sp.]|nr:UDP-N-acetylenolpyruvoylglucosamine reductase [Anaerolinea sp.]
MTTQFEYLQNIFGSQLTLNVPLHRYTTARVGGNTAALLTVQTSDELVKAVHHLHQIGSPYKVIGEGSNILFSDAGYDGVIIVNRTCQLSFDLSTPAPLVYADAGVNLVTLSRKIAEQGLSGFEWACGIPGTLGGAIYGNAGAHGSGMETVLESASILHPHGRLEDWPSVRFQYQYRSSILKTSQSKSIILSAVLRMEKKEQNKITSLMGEYTARRKATQPVGASLGSIFKNPPGDYAGRLIEAAGYKGHRIGGVAVSEKHANFFIIDNQASATDIYKLIKLVQNAVIQQSGVTLETEIELLGNFTLEQHDDAEN